MSTNGVNSAIVGRLAVRRQKAPGPCNSWGEALEGGGGVLVGGGWVGEQSGGGGEVGGEKTVRVREFSFTGLIKQGRTRPQLMSHVPKCVIIAHPPVTPFDLTPLQRLKNIL